MWPMLIILEVDYMILNRYTTTKQDSAMNVSAANTYGVVR